MGPQKIMQQWAGDGQMGSHSIRQKQLSRLLMSIHVAPWSADRHMDLARFYTWHMHRMPRHSPQYQIYALRTQQQILEAVRWRPGWGFAWAALAENSAASGAYKPVTNEYLARGLRYGPYEPGTLNKLALVGMLHWRELPQALRQQVQMAIVRALKINNHHVNLIRLAFSLQWQEHLLPLLQTPAQRAEYHRQIQRLAS